MVQQYKEASMHLRDADTAVAVITIVVVRMMMTKMKKEHLREETTLRGVVLVDQLAEDVEDVEDVGDIVTVVTVAQQEILMKLEKR